MIVGKETEHPFPCDREQWRAVIGRAIDDYVAKFGEAKFRREVDKEWIGFKLEICQLIYPEIVGLHFAHKRSHFDCLFFATAADAVMFKMKIS